ncbi:phage tail assembly chaperone [Zhenpiania hominis]|uniref:Phage XkdN-like protein n=1 Tax=Zhenpiania hominis TaxID=2763644 RepID=A0A923NNQ3_9FIRM|nr:hypothetical protein [Zhenpiania hominis]MBC6681315.1 hypothetical protein [Zhenpiania hominis]
MNLAEKLIRIDKEKVKEKETKKIHSKKLSKLLGEPTEITIQELSGKTVNDITQMIFDKKGNRDMSRLYEQNLMCCVEGVVEPNLKDSQLMEHFGAATPKDLAAILFGVESGAIASEISALSGFSGSEEDEIKN